MLPPCMRHRRSACATSRGEAPRAPSVAFCIVQGSVLPFGDAPCVCFNGRENSGRRPVSFHVRRTIICTTQSRLTPVACSPPHLLTANSHLFLAAPVSANVGEGEDGRGQRGPGHGRLVAYEHAGERGAGAPRHGAAAVGAGAARTVRRRSGPQPTLAPWPALQSRPQPDHGHHLAGIHSLTTARHG